MLVSVRIITYNQVEYITQCLESVLNQQTIFDFEIVVGDDCSTDMTGVVLEQFRIKYPERLKLLRYDHNIGVFENSRRTFEASSGDYIFFLEGDDYWHNPFKLQKEIDFLENNPDFVMVHSDCDRYDEEKRRLTRNINRLKNRAIPIGYVFEELLQQNFITTCTTCVRQETLLKYDNYDFYKNNNFRMADYPRWLSIAQKEKIGYLDESLATYRILENSVSHPKDFNKKREFIDSIYDVKKYFISKYGCSLKIKLNVEENYLKRRLILAYKEGDLSLAKSLYRELKNMPEINIKNHIKYFLYFVLTIFSIGKTNRLFSKRKSSL